VAAWIQAREVKAMTSPAEQATSTEQATPTEQVTPTEQATSTEQAVPASSGPALAAAVLVRQRLFRQNVPGSGHPSRYFFSAIWLVYLIEPVSALFGHGHGVLYIAGGLAITAAFCVLYLPLTMNVDRWPREAQAGLVGLVGLTSLACVVYGRDWTPLWIYVSAAVGVVLAATRTRRQASVGVVAVGVLYTFFCWLSHQDLADFLAVLLPVLLVGLAMIGFRMQVELMQELREARGTVARLAANEERLRLARDMHDLTGQSLSMITLKSELAAKRLARLPESAERDSVLTELGDIGRVSRQTLHDIREAVSGYRRPTLAIEVITARNALEAAGIAVDDDAELTLRSGTFDPAAEAVLAWCLREAVTNVIRHSGARRCQIRLAERRGELSLDITDDGQGLPQAAPAGAAGTDEASNGSGLRGMSERLSAVGGRLSLGRTNPAGPGPAGTGGGFRLVATVPVTDVPAGSGHNDDV
jgi:two-component system sensor histidine kinase DesK